MSRTRGRGEENGCGFPYEDGCGWHGDGRVSMSVGRGCLRRLMAEGREVRLGLYVDVARVSIERGNWVIEGADIRVRSKSIHMSIALVCTSFNFSESG